MMTENNPPSPLRRGGRGRGAGGWAPAFGEARQKDQTRANARAKSLRSDQTESEKKLWRLLQQLNKEGAHFRAAGGFQVVDKERGAVGQRSRVGRGLGGQYEP